MQSNQKSHEELFASFLSFLSGTMRRATRVLERYVDVLKELKLFMDKRRLVYYDESVGAKFLRNKFGHFSPEKLVGTDKQIVQRINALNNFNEGKGFVHGKAEKIKRIFSGVVGKVMNDWIKNRQKNFDLKESTVDGYEFCLHALLQFLESSGVKNFKQLDISHILSFVKSLNPSTPATKYVIINTIKRFLEHVYDQHLLPQNYATTIPNYKFVKDAKLPSTYTAEEIKSILEMVDRANPRGKRDYAILLLAVKLGLRASDIAAIEFKHIVWEKNILECPQIKNESNVSLPLLPEIGNAIIDYLKYGRPASDETHCFLQHLPPFKPIRGQDLCQLVNKYMKKAGINTTGRKHGPHALRHSFAANLLQNKTLLPVISEAMGHRHSDATMIYLRVDKAQLKKCALEVPLVPKSFYNQKAKAL